MHSVIQSCGSELCDIMNFECIMGLIYENIMYWRNPSSRPPMFKLKDPTFRMICLEVKVCLYLARSQQMSLSFEFLWCLTTPGIRKDIRYLTQISTRIKSHIIIITITVIIIITIIITIIICTNINITIIILQAFGGQGGGNSMGYCSQQMSYGGSTNKVCCTSW